MTMTMTASRVRARKNKVLRSVFPIDVSQPTPLLVSTAPGELFGGPLASTAAVSDANTPSLQPAGDQVRWDRAWHAVTSKIQLPSSVAVEDSFGTAAPDSRGDDSSFRESLALVLDAHLSVPCANHTEDILQWHTQQVRQHFMHHVLPLLAACAAQDHHAQVLLSSVQTLEAAHRQYLYGLHVVVRGIRDQAAGQLARDRFSRDLHAIIGNSWARGLVEALRGVVYRLLAAILASSRCSTAAGSGRWQGDDERRVPAAREELLSLLESLNNVGLGGDRLHVLFAEVMDTCMGEFIQQTYAGVWTALDSDGKVDADSSSGCMAHLCDWVENHYARLAAEVFSRLGGQVARAHVQQWREIAVGRLASLRMQELFDIVLDWPRSKGGLEDLRCAVATPQRRLQLTDTFSASVQKRLLHPGRSTLNILQTYISMIKTFHQLDASKVLLDRVAHALQLYLCQRDDAIRIVVTGLLSNPAGTSTNDARTQLVELGVLLNEASEQQQQQRAHVDEDDLDWDDMSWVPDPVDAGPNYKRPKTEDVIGTLISALGSQEIFIKEFQSIMAERLLSNQAGFQQEIKVLSLLKRRFGDSALQNCDVMVKDIYDSRRVDALLRKSLRGSRGHVESCDKYHAKILSRLFWPSLPREPFTVPAPVAEVQAQYEAGFERLKTSRKLTWLDHIGSATVQLNLQDRSIELECKTYEAAVIYAFQSDDGSQAGPKQHTLAELWQKLMIDEDLLDSALRFWISKSVLKDAGNQTYVVLERVQDGETATDARGDAASVAGGEDAGPLSSRRTRIDPKEQERRRVYWQFIVGMLTNSGPAMPLGQIAMMMKMLIADGCSWGNEELQEFLGDKISEGVLELSGGKYRLVKK